MTENRDYFGPGKVKFLHFLSFWLTDKKHACGDISVKWYFVVHRTFVILKRNVD